MRAKDVRARRHGDRAQGRRRHPRGRRPGRWRCARTAPSRGRSRSRARRAATRSSARRARPTAAASSRRARRSCHARIGYWASRGAMDIEGLGDRTVAQLIASGLVEDPADIYGADRRPAARPRGLRHDQRREARRRHRRIADAAAAAAAHRPRHQAPRAVRRRRAGVDVRHARCGDRRAGRGPRRRRRRRRGDRRVDPHVVRPREQPAFIEKLRAAGVDFGAARRAHRAGASRRRSPARPSSCPARSPGSAATAPPRRSSPAAARARAASAPRRYALVVGDNPGASKVSKAEQHGVPIIDEAAFEHLLETGDLPADPPPSISRSRGTIRSPNDTDLPQMGSAVRRR